GAVVGPERDLPDVLRVSREEVAGLVRIGAHRLYGTADERDDGDAARRTGRRRLIVVDRRAALGLPAVLRNERVGVDHAARSEDRIRRVADAVVVGVLALVVGPPI